MTALRRMLVMRRELPADPAWLRATPVALDTMWHRALFILFLAVPAVALFGADQVYLASNGDYFAGLLAFLCTWLLVVLLIVAVRIFRAVRQLRGRLASDS
jgi:hypothetical protein